MGGSETSEAGHLESARPEVLATGQRVYARNGSGLQVVELPPLPPPEPPALKDGEAKRKRRTIAMWKGRLVPKHFDRVELIDRSLLGAVGLLGGCRPVIGYGPTWTSVWIEAPLWGWSNGNQVFVNRNHVESGVAYAMRLADAIRDAAGVAEQRREGAKVAFLNGLQILNGIEEEEARKRGRQPKTLGELRRIMTASPDAPIYEESGHGRISIGYGCTWVRASRGDR